MKDGDYNKSACEGCLALVGHWNPPLKSFILFVIEEWLLIDPECSTTIFWCCWKYCPGKLKWKLFASVAADYHILTYCLWFNYRKRWTSAQSYEISCFYISNHLFAHVNVKKHKIMRNFKMVQPLFSSFYVHIHLLCVFFSSFAPSCCHPAASAHLKIIPSCF